MQGAEDMWFAIRGSGMRIHVSEFRDQNSKFGFGDLESGLGFQFVPYLVFKFRV